MRVRLNSLDGRWVIADTAVPYKIPPPVIEFRMKLYYLAASAGTDYTGCVRYFESAQPPLPGDPVPAQVVRQVPL